MTIISIVIPAYNCSHLLPRAIRSVLNQNVQDFEIIIVDDASSDNTSEIVRSFQEKDNRIQYIRLDENSGGAARPKNIAIRELSGEYIATLDADDEWMPEKLEKQLALFEQSDNPKLGFVGCNYLTVYENGKEAKYRVPWKNGVLDRILESDFMGTGSTMMYRREVFDEVGGFDEELNTGQDWEMRIRLAERYDYDFVDGEPLVKYYIHASNISHLALDKKQKNLRYIEKKHKELYRSRPKVYSNKLRYDGTRFMIAGRRLKAWKAFLRSLRYNALNIKSYIYLFLSFFGQKVYLRLTQLKQERNSRSI